jgi:iron complex outermembrane receptor protein
MLTTGAVVVVASQPAYAQATSEAPAVAQQSTSDNSGGRNSPDAQGGDIVVTGIRSSLRSAVEQKRAASNIEDAITAEDIGKFPTENVADASQRITGVQITRTRGTGAQASIRGLPPAFTRVQLNGSTLSSALVDLQGGGAGGDISRSFDFRLLPTEFVRTLAVTKSPTADMQEGGLSGTIDVETVRPLDLRKTAVTASAFAVRNSNSGKATPRISGLASTTLLDGRLGVLFAGGYDKAKTETQNVGNDGWNTFAESAVKKDFNSDGDMDDTFNIPSQVRTEIFDEKRERLTLASIIEFQASDQVKLYAEGFYGHFKIHVDDKQNLHIFTNATGGVFDPSTTQFTDIDGIDPTVLTSGHPFATSIGLQNVDTRGLDRINNSKANTYYAKGGAEFNGQGWKGDVSFAYSKSDMSGDNTSLTQVARFDVTEQCLPGEQVCGITFPEESQQRYLDPNQPIVASVNGAFGRRVKDNVAELKANLAHEFDDSIISKISVGGVASWRHTYSNAPTIVVPAAAIAALVGLQPSTVQGTGYSTMPYEMIVKPGSGSFLGHYGGSLTFPTSWVSSNTEAFFKDVSRADLAAAGAVNQNQTSIIDLNENILAGYIRADFGHTGDLVTGNFGLRVVRTASTARGFAPDFSGIRVLVDAGGTVTVPAADPIAAKHTYTEFLPSANAKINLTDNFLLRFAASRTMSRPTLTDISPSTTIAGVGNNFTITAGNPNLEPFISLNFDFSAEWYPNPDTALTVALFSKDLSTLVRPVTTSVTMPVTFVTTSTNTTEVRDQVFQRTVPTNEQGVTLKGVEIGYQQYLSFLPGLFSHTGFQANYTFISNSDPQVLTAASKNNFNVSAFYENAGLALRASYTWRDKFVSTGLPDGYYGLGITTRPRGNLDVNVTYDITDNVSLVFEGSNVLNNADATRTTLGDLPQYYYDTGSQYMLGARVKF